MKTSLNDHEYIQYSKQMLLTDVSEKGQLALMNATAIIVGVGGLGQLVAQYLAASGVSIIHLIDGDDVELSNLPRQILFNANDIGSNKASIAMKKLHQRNVVCDLSAHQVFINPGNYQALFDSLVPKSSLASGLSSAVLFDCCDNFTTRQLVNRIAIEYKMPLISASISADQGQWFVYLPQSNSSETQALSINSHGCYHCVYPSDSILSQNCSQAGVLGPAVGVMASMQALAGMNQMIGRPIEYGVLHRFDAKRLSWSKAKMNIDKHCHVCQ
ncbi:HesA/MoeB/ThiF family protein [Shewanella glacialimarina]|uniref:HesA/MoeB/ThiF family protein n=1 Tax=Shewanella glacialimarina TaxID=2590884 RepID=UPI001CF8F718|nr:HesA/MoeB/ThiF family protein [Shewanella glacialimarina]UCX04510.1 HesA/MoeB/ThiF family protein [Shewanella glacialimarina]